MIYENILEAIGNTPLVRLARIVPEDSAEILVKYEGMGVGGSIKTRTALAMLRAAMAEGKIKEDSIIVEATSGNQGIGLALAGAVLGLHTVIVMPDSVSEERRLLVRQYGAEVRLVHDAGDIGRAIRECQETVDAMAAADPRVFVPAQFENPENPRIHETTTAREILRDAEGPLDGFCSGIGTGGTLTGIGRVLKAENPDMLVVAIEPEEAAILSGGTIGTHLQMGIGDGIVPPILDASVIDEIAIVTDEEALSTAKRLAREEGLLTGISGGSNVAVALRLAKRLGRGKRVVTILPDTGERYFSTPLFEESR
jgi:cysteine synthase A